MVTTPRHGSVSIVRIGVAALIVAVVGFAIAHDFGPADSGESSLVTADGEDSAAHTVFHLASGFCGAAAIVALGWAALRMRPLRSSTVVRRRKSFILWHRRENRRSATRGLLFELCLLRA